ncbi:MAG: glycosyltransferase family 4 protein [Gaiellaceae bacterium]
MRTNADRFDVIEATQGDLPYSKSELGFNGLLVARSAALFHFFDEYDRFARRRWPEHQLGTAPGRAVDRWAARRSSAAARRSLLHADLVNVANQADYAYVRDELGVGSRVLLMPLGLRDADAAALAAAARPSSERLAARRVAFVGQWSLRKGRADWGEIVARTRARVPDARFDFLGTVTDRTTILRDLGVGDVDWVTVLPHFEAAELPALLAGATVGAFPSYVEAFGLGVLEQLGAGLPVVAYDIPGPRDMLDRLDARRLLVARGDAGGLAASISELLLLDEHTYRSLGREMRERAG